MLLRSAGEAFSAPYDVPRTACPGCPAPMVPGRMVAFQPLGHPSADLGALVLWHVQCMIIAGREARECPSCGDRHYVEGACLI